MFDEEELTEQQKEAAQKARQEQESIDRAEEKKKINKILDEMESIKERASAEYKKGMYDEAILIYE